MTGMVLKTVPIGEYDRRVVILTKERGKISAFAKGARKPNSRFVAATSLFAFGEFKMYEGRSSYNIMDADISNYFAELREDFEAACYGMYFLELMDYYTRENNEESGMLKLLYQSIRALMVKSLDRKLVRTVFEIKSLVINGEYPGIPNGKTYSESTRYTMNYIEQSTVERLYTFTVTESVLQELLEIAESYRKKYMDREFKSLEVLRDVAGI